MIRTSSSREVGEAKLGASSRVSARNARPFCLEPGRRCRRDISAFDVSVFCPSPAEGSPGAVILSMLAARPVVASGREGVADIITPGVGTIVTPDHDADVLASVLREYREDPERTAREGAAVASRPKRSMPRRMSPGLSKLSCSVPWSGGAWGDCDRFQVER